MPVFSRRQAGRQHDRLPMRYRASIMSEWASTWSWVPIGLAHRDCVKRSIKRASVFVWLYWNWITQLCDYTFGHRTVIDLSRFGANQLDKWVFVGSLLPSAMLNSKHRSPRPWFMWASCFILDLIRSLLRHLLSSVHSFSQSVHLLIELGRLKAKVYQHKSRLNAINEAGPTFEW